MDLNSGTTHHMSPYFSSFSYFFKIPFIFVMSTSNTSIAVEGVGSISVPRISLTDVCYISQTHCESCFG